MLFSVLELLAMHVLQHNLETLGKQQHVLGDSGQAGFYFFAAKHPHPYIQPTISPTVPEIDPETVVYD